MNGTQDIRIQHSGRQKAAFPGLYRRFPVSSRKGGLQLAQNLHLMLTAMRLDGECSSTAQCMGHMTADSNHLDPILLWGQPTLGIFPSLSWNHRSTSRLISEGYRKVHGRTVSLSWLLAQTKWHLAGELQYCCTNNPGISVISARINAAITDLPGFYYSIISVKYRNVRACMMPIDPAQDMVPGALNSAYCLATSSFLQVKLSAIFYRHSTCSSYDGQGSIESEKYSDVSKRMRNPTNKQAHGMMTRVADSLNSINDSNSRSWRSTPGSPAYDNSSLDHCLKSEKYCDAPCH